jgi:hypothetical protein
MALRSAPGFSGEFDPRRASDPITDQSFTATFSDDGNMITGRWEIAEDGRRYTTDFDLTYRRAGA